MLKWLRRPGLPGSRPLILDRGHPPIDVTGPYKCQAALQREYTSSMAASGWCRLRARHPYADNPFEREAFAKGRADPPDEAVRPPEDHGEGHADDHE